MYKKITMVGAMLLTGWAQAFVPQSGTWIVASELNGAPGRGLAIDVQEDTLVLQMYAYERSGQPTFYMAAGTLANNRVITKLGRYSGGRYLGSGALQGREDGSPGDVTMRFTSGISGFITLPGENEVAIKRYEFSLSKTPAAVAGTWVYVGVDSKDDFGDLVSLEQEIGVTQNGSGVVADTAKKIGCEYRLVDDGPYNMYCGQVSGSTIKWTAKLKVVGNEGEGISLDPISGLQDGIVYVRKSIDGKGRYLGLFAPGVASTPAPTPEPTPTPTPAPARSYAGSYSIIGGGISVTFTVNNDYTINRCTAGILVTCSGNVTSSGKFSLTGSDGDGTKVTLVGDIDSEGKVTGSYLGTSDGDFITGNFAGSRNGSGGSGAGGSGGSGDEGFASCAALQGTWKETAGDYPPLNPITLIFEGKKLTHIIDLSYALGSGSSQTYTKDIVSCTENGFEYKITWDKLVNTRRPEESHDGPPRREVFVSSEWYRFEGPTRLVVSGAVFNRR